MYKIGLIGKSLNHSFSKQYFDKKIKKELISNFSYDLYEISSIQGIKNVISKKNIIGLNITYPYKEKILKFINFLDNDAQEIQAVNTIFIDKIKSKITGYNTDWIGFYQSLDNFLPKKYFKALVLGSGGGSKAICYALKKKGITYKVISRKPKKNRFI